MERINLGRETRVAVLATEIGLVCGPTLAYGFCILDESSAYLNVGVFQRGGATEQVNLIFLYTDGSGVDLL